MRERSFVKALLCVFLLAGCGANQQWVKEYVGQEVTSAKSDIRERLQPLEQALDDNKMQVEKLRKDISGVDVKLNQLTEKLTRFTESLEEVNKSYKKGLNEVKKAMTEETNRVSEKVSDLNEKLQKLGKGLVTFQKSMEALEKRLEEVSGAGVPR